MADGVDDEGVVGFFGEAESPDTNAPLSVMSGNGDGTLTAVTYPSSGKGGTYTNTAVLDLNGDGYPDIFVGTYTLQAEIYYGAANGTFTGGPAVPFPDKQVDVFAQPYGILTSDEAGNFNLYQSASRASSSSRIESFSVPVEVPPPPPPGTSQGAATNQTQIYAVGDFDNSGVSGMFLANEGIVAYPGDHEFEDFQIYTATGMSSLNFVKSGFSFSSPIQVKAYFHPVNDPTVRPSASPTTTITPVK